MVVTSSILIFLLGVGAYIIQAELQKLLNHLEILPKSVKHEIFKDFDKTYLDKVESFVDKANAVMVLGFLVYFGSLVILFVQSRWFVPLIVFGANSIAASFLNTLRGVRNALLYLSFRASIVLIIAVIVFDFILFL